MTSPNTIEKPKLHTQGHVYVTLSAAEQYLDACPELDGIEDARRKLTERMLDAHMIDDRRARARARGAGIDVTAFVVREGRLLVVTGVAVQRRTQRRRLV